MSLDHFEKAKEKIEKYQWTSDIGTDDKENVIGERPIIKPKRYKTTSSESSDEGSTTHATTSKKVPPRPPTIVKSTLCNKSNITEAVGAQEAVEPLIYSSPLSQTRLRRTSIPVSPTQEVAASIEEEIDDGNITLIMVTLLLHNIYSHIQGVRYLF